MAKKKAKKGFRLLKLKIDPEHYEYLDQVAVLCRRARNAALEDWLLRQRGKPPSEKQSRPPTPRRKKQADGSYEMTAASEMTESTKIYHAVTAAEPSLDTQVASMMAQSIWTHLSAKVDWRRGKDDETGRKKRRRDAILEYEDRPPFFSGWEIPIRSANTNLKYGPWSGASVLLLRGDRRDIRIITDKLPPAIRSLLLDILEGKAKLLDSRLVKKNESWYWFLPVQVLNPASVVPDRVMTLMPVFPQREEPREIDRPFVLEAPDGGRRHVGDGRYYLAQMERLWAILKMIGWRYRQRCGTGHGRAKYDRYVSLRRRQMRDVTDEVRRRMIVRIVDYMEQHACGTLLYREPSLPLRNRCWFAQRGLDWDWTRFESDLENALARKGMVLDKKMLKLADVKGAAEIPMYNAGHGVEKETV